MPNRGSLLKWIPILFVLLWSTGFIGAKYGLPFAEPFTLLMYRMYLTLAAFLLLIHLFRGRWPDLRGAAHSMVVGALVHAAYLGGVFSAIENGMSAGLVSLLVGLQPILTTLVARGWMGEKVSAIQAAGLASGLAGVTMVLILGGKGAGSAAFSPDTLIYALVALFGISLGTLYQKHFCTHVHLLTGTFYQFLSTALIMTVLAFSFETREITWDPQFILALLWLVFGLSLTAILLLMVMIREGEAAKVASYFYLTPPVTALLAWLLFQEQLNTWAIGGMLVAVFGVYLVVRNPGWLRQRKLTP
ncbi:MAG: DMT family transporter [Gammaproteobacteria bacterium]|nr:DMT family transporter [Gammaproteobacteria bacterium]